MLFQQLLIDLFKFLAPFLRNAELAKQTHLLYKVTRNNTLWGHLFFRFASRPSFESHVTQLSSRLKRYVVTQTAPRMMSIFFVCYHEVEGTGKEENPLSFLTTTDDIWIKRKSKYWFWPFFRAHCGYCLFYSTTSQNSFAITTSVSVTSSLQTASKWGIWSWAPSRATCGFQTPSRLTWRYGC